MVDEALEIHDAREPRTWFEDVLHVLRETDDEFHPPLSERGDASSGMEGEGGVEAYVDRTLEDGVLVAELDGDAVGVMVYRDDYAAEYVDDAAVYVDTVAVTPGYQGEGVGRRLYDTLFEAVDSDVVATRTWESNSRHLRLLDDLGFEVVRRRENHRPGGVDSLYLVRRS